MLASISLTEWLELKQSHADLLAALQEYYHAFGNCGSPRQQKAADAALQAIRKASGDPDWPH